MAEGGGELIFPKVWCKLVQWNSSSLEGRFTTTVSFTRLYSFLPSFLLSVRPSLRPFVRPSDRLFVRSTIISIIPLGEWQCRKRTLTEARCAPKLENETPIRMETKHLGDSKMKHPATSATIISNSVFPLKLSSEPISMQEIRESSRMWINISHSTRKEKPTYKSWCPYVILLLLFWLVGGYWR